MLIQIRYKPAFTEEQDCKNVNLAQKKAMKKVLEKNGDLIYVDRTGRGKSAVVFGPAAVKACVTVLVFPLIRMREDIDKGLESVTNDGVDVRDFDISQHKFPIKGVALCSPEKMFQI